MSTPEQASEQKLVYMANQVGGFYKAQREGEAVARIAEHFTKFWDPRMRRALLAHLDSGGAGLDPIVLAAMERLRRAE